MNQGDPQKRVSIFNTKMDCYSMRETVELIMKRIEGGFFTQHVVVNVAKIVGLQDNESLRSAVNRCDIINIDGMGVVWAARAFGFEVPERVAGIDLFMALVKESTEKKLPIYLLGAKTSIVEKTATVLRSSFPGVQIVGYENGYFWGHEEEVVTRVRDSGAKLLFVAITSPKKEIFIDKWKDELGVSFVMGVGGTFDVVAGKVRRAPKLMQSLGLEWLFRLMQEPRRMLSRYMLSNFRFLLLCVQKKWKNN